jgi:hypothetical protein
MPSLSSDFATSLPYQEVDTRHTVVGVNLVPIQEAAKRVGLSRNTLHRYVSLGLLKRYTSPFDRKTYIDLDELERIRKEPPLKEG